MDSSASLTYREAYTACTINLIESQIRSVKDNIECIKNEVETLNLEETWCYDSKGNRTIPTAEEQAAEISQRLAEFPHLVEDTVKALRQKKIDLQCDLKELEQRSEELLPSS